MTKKFVLPMLAALPALLVSCDDDVYTGDYQRLRFNSYEECVQYYRVQIAQGLQNPCAPSASSSSGGGVFYYGPYYSVSGRSTHYLGYNRSGTPAEQGLSYDSKSGRYGSFKAGGTGRGGFTSSSRSGGFGG